jgi:hypothetical protein
MPSRYIREAYLDSETVSRAGEPAEVMFFRLALVVDDYGRFDGRVSIIQRKCWPIGKTTDPTIEEVERRLMTLDEVGLAQRYTVDGKPYIFIPKFKQRTRSTKSKWPAPPTQYTPPVGHPADMPPSMSGHPADDPPADSGQGAADCPPRTRSSTRSVSRSISISRDAHAQEDPVDNPQPPVPGSRAAPPTGETPAEFFKRNTKRPDPFADPDRAEGAGT